MWAHRKRPPKKAAAKQFTFHRAYNFLIFEALNYPKLRTQKSSFGCRRLEAEGKPFSGSSIILASVPFSSGPSQIIFSSSSATRSHRKVLAFFFELGVTTYCPAVAGSGEHRDVTGKCQDNDLLHQKDAEQISRKLRPVRSGLVRWRNYRRPFRNGVSQW